VVQTYDEPSCGAPSRGEPGAGAFSVVIVNYNGEALVGDALRSLARQSVQGFDVVVVDNASEDGSVAMLEAMRDTGRNTGQDKGQDALPFTLIESGENLGFSGGANLGARAARGEWVVMLNPDARAEPDWMAAIIAGVGRYHGIAHFACTQLEDDNPDRVDGAGDCYSVYGFAWRAAQGHARARLPEGDRFCLSACGASAVYHRETFLGLGGFDERFFCYLEDVDMGYRMQRAGHDCVWLSGAVVRHADGATTRKLPGFREFHTARNRVWVLWKNTPAVMLPVTLAGWALMSAFLSVRGIGTGEPKVMWAGYRAAFKALPRRRARTPRTLGLWALLGRLSWNPIDHKRHRPRFRALSSGLGKAARLATHKPRY